ncbi:MAG: RnfABCDGE type electron transport complex subunit B, partial [Treponema sp.]|nr:RnfABCDGE type electron transport complex subunit B [Treponema sp.]
NVIVITALFALGLAFLLGLALGFFKQFFAVPEDPLAGQIREALPGANCGACGFPGCDGYAAAMAAGETGPDRCTVGGAETAKKLSAILGVEASVVPQMAVIACRGYHDKALLKGTYTGIETCRGAKISAGGTKLCAWGCIGFGDCVRVCKFGALSMGPRGVPLVDHRKCVGCRMCSAECPQFLIRIIPREQKGAMPVCSNRNPIRTLVARYCKSGCIKCELCVKNCPEQCITMQNGIPAVDNSKCVSCGVCTAKCPTKVLKLIQRDILEDIQEKAAVPEEAKEPVKA